MYDFLSAFPLPDDFPFHHIPFRYFSFIPTPSKGVEPGVNKVTQILGNLFDLTIQSQRSTMEEARVWIPALLLSSHFYFYPLSSLPCCRLFCPLKS
jgi:hypothetical protein